MEEKNLPFISVIVPFYNIEECVEYCLDSLVSQDYEGKYEVLCIDDGSTDGTAAALDTYATNHQIVRVLHKPNGGPSDARNYGVEHAKGEYVSFVDGDDIVSPYYLSALAVGHNQSGADFISGCFDIVGFRDVRSKSWSRPEGCNSMDARLFLSGICCLTIPDSAWGKLAKKDLYIEHPFPVGRVYEDTYVIAEHVLAATSLAFIDVPIYGYVARNGSIAHPKAVAMTKCLQYSEALDHFRDMAERYLPFESDGQVVFRAIGFSRLWRRLDAVRDFPEDAKRLQATLCGYVNGHLGQLVESSCLGRGNKIRLALLAKSPALYRAAFSAYDKVFRRFV